MKKSLFQIRNSKFYILPSILILLFFLSIILSPFSAYGYDGEVGGRFLWWRDPEIVKELELSNNQVNQIEGIFSAHKEQMIKLDFNLRKKEAELRDAIKNPNSSREEVLRLTDEVENIKGNMKRVKLDMFLQIRDVLTPQQRSKLQEIKTRR